MTLVSLLHSCFWVGSVASSVKITLQCFSFAEAGVVLLCSVVSYSSSAGSPVDSILRTEKKIKSMIKSNVGSGTLLKVMDNYNIKHIFIIIRLQELQVS